MSKKTKSIRNKIHRLLERESGSLLAGFVHYFLMALIVMTVIAVILESDPEIYQQHQTLFDVLEMTSIIIFTIEYFSLASGVCPRPIWQKHSRTSAGFPSPVSIQKPAHFR